MVACQPSTSLDAVLLELTASCKNTPNDGEIVTAASSGIKKALDISRASAQPLGNDAQDAVLNFVWKYWDFIVDKVCYDCADVLIRLIELHLSTCGACSAVEKCKWVRGMFNELFSSPVSCKARYKAIVALYALLPNEVAQRFNQPFMDVLYAKMGSFTLSVVLSELICADLEARRDERNWDYHVKSMINLLSAGPGHCSPLDRLLPRIMKNPLLRIGFVDKLMDAVKASTSATADFLVGRMALAKFVVFTRTTCQWRDFVLREEMARALLHVNVQVRLTALSLLCEHPKRTLFIELEDCELALAYIESNMTEQEPSNRQKILASLKKFLMRLCDVADQISKKPGETGPVVGYSDFLRRLAALAIESIKPGANFSRRIMALSILDLLYKDEVLNLDGKETLRSHAHLEDLLTEDLRALLIGCFDDSFQICQKEALRLLQTLKFPENFDFDSFIAVTESQLDSLRSHDSLSLSYRLRYYAAKRPNDVAGLLERLIKKVLASCEALDKESLIAISARLLHPTLSSIALLLEPKPAIAPEIWSTQILPMCFRAANLVRPVVHDLSPEGYVPEELLRKIDNTTGECLAPQVSQTLVACCWRAHKQISTILSLAAGQLEVLPPADVLAVFDFYWLELTECRHCGAFESAVDGFQVLCRRLWAVQNPHLPNMLAALSGILEAIDGKNDLDKLCSTRRSAGLPYLVAALCSTDPGCSALDLAMGKLMEFEGRESTSRIHSLNVLRSLFMHSELGERVLRYAEKAVKLGVEGCSAPNWSERNASAQLVASLRTRLFGVARAAKVELHVDERNTRSAFEFFSRYPSLYPFLFDHLSKHSFHDEFGLFPVLVLLSHLNPSTNASNPFPLHPFVPKIMKLLLTLRSEKLRKLAVAALVAISTREDLLYCLEIFSGLDIARLPHNVLDSLFNLLLTIAERRPHDYQDPRMYFLFKAQNRGILAKAVENGAYLDYNDYVLNQFFQLCLMTGMHDPMRKLIENKELLDKLTLALRPLARFAVAQQFPPKILKEHPAFRREVYREILKSNCVTSADWTLFLCSGYSEVAIINDFSMVLDSLVGKTETHDAAYYPTQPNLRKLTSLILRHYDMVKQPAVEKITTAIRQALNDTTEHEFSPDTEMLLRELAMLLKDEWTPADADWIRNRLADDTPEVLPAALRLCKKLEPRTAQADIFAPVFALLLQSSDAAVREEASVSLGHFVDSNAALNPAITWRLFAEDYPNLRRQLVPIQKAADVEADEKAQLFDACTVNAYAETQLFSDFAATKNALKIADSSKLSV